MHPKRKLFQKRKSNKRDKKRTTRKSKRSTQKAKRSMQKAKRSKKNRRSMRKIRKQTGGQNDTAVFKDDQIIIKNDDNIVKKVINKDHVISFQVKPSINNSISTPFGEPQPDNDKSSVIYNFFKYDGIERIGVKFKALQDRSQIQLSDRSIIKGKNTMIDEKRIIPESIEIKM